MTVFLLIHFSLFLLILNKQGRIPEYIPSNTRKTKVMDRQQLGVFCNKLF